MVVVPPDVDRRLIPRLIAREQRWIDKALRNVAQQRAALMLPPDTPLPGRISLRALGEEWTVSYRATTAAWVAAKPLSDGVSHSDPRLLVSGAVEDAAACQAALRRWLHRNAHAHLVPWLQAVREEIALPIKRIRHGRILVRNPRTRWASYSQNGTISLSQNLLFLPPRLVRYVFIHERCHAVHPNHSARFWALLETKIPDTKVLREELRTAWIYVPAWATLV